MAQRAFFGKEQGCENRALIVQQVRPCAGHGNADAVVALQRVRGEAAGEYREQMDALPGALPQ